MKYFFDCEFIEGFHKPLFGKRRHFIDLISIGIYCEDGREYYALSNEFNPKKADKWVKENVLDKIELEYHQKESAYAKYYHWECLNLKNFMRWYGKSNRKIAEEIEAFINPHVNYKRGDYFNDKLYSEDYWKRHNTKEFVHEGIGFTYWRNQPEFYGYYAGYDWVLFCSLFGRMIDLPNGFPMYCKDLKQMFDQKFNDGYVNVGSGYDSIEAVKSRKDYPKQENEHNALADAKWNFQLYKFLQSI